MKTHPWQLKTPLQAILFDCDGTLSHIEGIDALAEQNGVEDMVAPLTQNAMSSTGMNPDVFQKRLDLVYPTLDQMLAIGQEYFARQTEDAAFVIEIFKRLKKSVYIISAGLFPSVSLFGELLGVSRNHIYAVNVYFDQEGRYIDFDRHSPLIYNDGKRVIVSALKEKNASLAYVGDGLNDIAVSDLVTRFIGYGGTVYREAIAQQCHYYIHQRSLASLLPLCLTLEETKLLTETEKNLYQKGLDAILQKQVTVE